MRLLSSLGLLKGKMLDYGCGRGFDANYYKMDKYDPFYSPDYPKEKYDTITCNFVLNVISEEEAKIVIDKIHSLLKDNGSAFFTVRRDIKKEGVTSKLTFQRNVILDFEIVKETRDFCIYRMEKK